MLPFGEKKYYIIIIRWQHVLGLCVEGFEMHDSPNLVPSLTGWRCGTPHKAPPLPGNLEHFGGNPAMLQAEAAFSVL